MKTLRKVTSLLAILFIVIGCSDNTKDTSNDITTITGELQLSGDDTSDVGTTLKIGDVAEGRKDLTGTEDSIVMVGEGTTISNEAAEFGAADPRNTEIFKTNDPNNGFVIVIADFTGTNNSAVNNSISMTILVDGTSYKYACVSPESVFIGCSDVTINFEENKVDFSNATVENTTTNTILTINGSVTWE